MVNFPEAELAETKREIVNLVNKKEMEFLMQKQIHVPPHSHQYQQHMPSPPVHPTNYFLKASFQMNHQQTAKVPTGFIPRHIHKFRKTCQQTITSQYTLDQNKQLCLLLTKLFNALLI
jgi:hypothetical protein